MERIPRRPYGSALSNRKNDKLAKEVSIIGLGCSSFSDFFDAESASIQSTTLNKNDIVVQGWIQTIRFAILEAGINLLDTAPWYGHGTSETVVGWAMEGLLLEKETDRKNKETRISRKELVLNTKVGRYEADPNAQFDFSRSMTFKSVKGSLERMQCDYIDVLQLHDPEFAPSLSLLLGETIPAMRECQQKGWCRALGLTGFPLAVQYQIFQASLERFRINVWDQSLTYGHFNLHDSSLLYQPMSLLTSSVKVSSYIPSFRNVLVDQHNVGVIAAAPLSMGLFTPNDEPPDWHPAGAPLQSACSSAKDICDSHRVNIASLAILYAISHLDIPCTLLGMKSIDQVEQAASLARRLLYLEKQSTLKDHAKILQSILTNDESAALAKIQDRDTGPFAGAEHWSWDGVKGAVEFWKSIGVEMEVWQQRQL